jgi:hypothetical protein
MSDAERVDRDRPRGLQYSARRYQDIISPLLVVIWEKNNRKQEGEHKEELHAYLVALRQKCHVQLFALTDERARQAVDYPWAKGRTVSFLELQLYSMRHVQEHAAQLNLFLGQRTIPTVPDMVLRAQDESGN